MRQVILSSIRITSRQNHRKLPLDRKVADAQEEENQVNAYKE
jgi:hypothetical protein